eukprot:TRINITY_DN68125_c6_g2_i6.p1 TRINITY_DN68125_c6_g2~~TRINITY_DN68125_c6_g2_i6.p1  ORF type:complete len:255 (-),score=5.60 TRINITY_DN68125_c6_g2_i6:61-783(-)
MRAFSMVNTLAGCLKECTQSFSERQQSLISERDQWDQAKRMVSDMNSVSEDISAAGSSLLLFLDVGGTEIHTSQSTFRNSRASDSMLGAWLSGEWEWEIEREEEDGLIFIDRDGAVFRGILDWLRDGTDHLIFSDKPDLQCDFLWCGKPSELRTWITALLRESIYFGLSVLTTWCQQQSRVAPVFTHHKYYNPRPDNTTIDFENGMFTNSGGVFRVAGLPPLSNSSTDWNSHLLRQSVEP